MTITKGIDSVPQKFVDDHALDVQHNEAEGHDPPTNEMCETAEAGVTQMVGTPCGSDARL